MDSSGAPSESKPLENEEESGPSRERLRDAVLPPPSSFSSSSSSSDEDEPEKKIKDEPEKKVDDEKWPFGVKVLIGMVVFTFVVGLGALPAWASGFVMWGCFLLYAYFNGDVAL